MLSLPSKPGKNLGKVWENSRAGDNVRLGFQLAMKAGKTCFIS